ncbi:tRNA U34 5-methylaminomethyl-2-thiouridine-forming methyltransferase MnmC [Flavobacteriaceae bacterium MAR_2010_72]|nr:tRNA U34 5-methylaminomethyl-2-thiouridine-forming methyltransferase MnmC [Flavobacteriaceae bacterium MAR_2010_72]
MKRQIITTADGSKTIRIEEWNEHYHSVHGAIQEANHVYIKHGLFFYFETIVKNIVKPIPILEIGFGTGLNAFMTFLESQKQSLKINYVGVEAFPLSTNELEPLNYIEELAAERYAETFNDFHKCPWGMPYEISPKFQLTKLKKDFKDIDEQSKFDLIYFDAFGARVQPELWTEAIFHLMYEALKPKGVLVTYSSKGSVRRAMQAVGFNVEKLPGPLGKREMLRARKGA